MIEQFIGKIGIVKYKKTPPKIGDTKVLHWAGADKEYKVTLIDTIHKVYGVEEK